VEQNLRLVVRELSEGREIDVNLSPTQCPLEFHVPAQAIAWAKALLRDSRPIAVHPGAGAAIKLWRAERWAAVADVLAKETGVDVLLTGSEAERPLCQRIAAQMKTEARVTAGETTLDQLAALLSQCRLVLGLDSGPMHLAVAVGTPTVQLYGPVDPTIFGPWGSPERHRVLASAWPCIPCNRLDYGSDELADHPCVREIEIPAVLAAAREVLSA
jgi:heptosyltransferase-2/heptosyltransferase-3